MPTVFLSYARKDDESFVRHLYADLTKSGFDIWWDRVSMPSRGLTFLNEIRDAINARDRMLLVVGPGSVTSDYVIAEWRHAVTFGIAVTPILRLDGEQEDGRKVDGYSLIPSELTLLHTEDFRDDSAYAQHLENLGRILAEPLAPMGKIVGLPDLPRHLITRSDRVRSLKDAVLSDLLRPVVITGTAARVGVHGMGGIGKSVLANLLARDPDVRRAFPDGIIWIPFGISPDLTELQRNVALIFAGVPRIFENVSQGRHVLAELLESKKVLLVLDDVWERAHAEAFNVLGPLCRAVITTRDAGLVTSMGGTHYQVQTLTSTEARSLLAAAVTIKPEALPREALMVIAECGGLALAVALCGGMARRGVTWASIVQRLREAALENIGDEHPDNETHRTLWTAMRVSVEALKPDQQQRFIELCVFPNNESVPEPAIATLWSHTGGISDFTIEELLVSLSERSLIRVDVEAPEAGQSPRRTISMHDLLHDYVTRAAGDPKPRHKKLIDAYRKLCQKGWPSGPNDHYFFDHLPQHLARAGLSEELNALLGDSRWLCTRMRVSSLGVAGLNSVLFGDYLRSSGQTADDSLILIEGAAGTGKTTLALQLLVRMATWGSRCMFVTTAFDEARARKLIKRVRLSDWKDEIENTDTFSPPDRSDGAETITILHVPWSKDGKHLLRDLPRLIPPSIAAVLIDDVEGDNSIDRPDVFAAVHFFQKNNILAMLTSEIHIDGEPIVNLFAYLADIVIRLDTRLENGDRFIRTLEVFKGRRERFKIGTHRIVLTDRSNRGIEGVEVVIHPVQDRRTPPPPLA